MYRPQFLYPLPPAPCEDQTAMFSFDKTNMPYLNHVMAVGERSPRLPLKLDKDADFYLRGIDTQGPVAFRLEDADGNPLSDSENFRASHNYEYPNEYINTAGAGFVALDSGSEGIPAKAGGNYLVYFYNPFAVTIDLTTCALNLIGVKRYKGVCP